MAVPQPILTTISAFDATQGTTITFTILSGDEVVRSSKLYIYDNEDGSLICTHIYTSTARQHVLPANTDASIIYESGKSSADFTNEKQYRTAIQLFTAVNGGGNASGISSPFQQFWCLNYPTLTAVGVNSPIAVTSYNFSAIYDTKIVSTTLAITNRIQRYQFVLYNSASQVVQTGNTIIGTGTQLTDTTFQISQNFTGLRDGETYYAVITCSTEQGMLVSTQTASVSVQIDTVTFNKADVTNYCKRGYNSVVSNIINIVGETNITTPIEELAGYIDLRGDKYLIWRSGYTFPAVQVDNLLSNARWDLSIWGWAFERSSYTTNETSNTSFVFRLENPDSGSGMISLFIVQGYDYGSSVLQTRADLYVTPASDGVTYFTYSNYINNPAELDNINIHVRCVDGLYEVELHEMS